MKFKTVKPGNYDDYWVCIGWVDKCLEVAKEKGIECYVTISADKPERKITEPQFNAMHVWLRMVAKALNEAGFSRHLDVIGANVDFDEEHLKEDYWKPLMGALKEDAKSTKEQSTDLAQRVYMELTRFWGEKGVEVPEWPSNR